MTAPRSPSLLLRQDPAVQPCERSRGSWIQTPLPTPKSGQAAPCCPPDVDARGTSHGLSIPQPTQVATAPEGDVGLGGSPQQPGGLVPARQAHIRAPTPSENAASAARVSAGEPVDMATPCGGSARPRVPPASPRCLESPGAPTEWLWDTAGSQHGWWQGGGDAAKCHTRRKNNPGVSMRCKALHFHSDTRPPSPCGFLAEALAMLEKANRRGI